MQNLFNPSFTNNIQIKIEFIHSDKILVKSWDIETRDWAVKKSLARYMSALNDWELTCPLGARCLLLNDHCHIALSLTPPCPSLPTSSVTSSRRREM